MNIPFKVKCTSWIKSGFSPFLTSQTKIDETSSFRILFIFSPPSSNIWNRSLRTPSSISNFSLPGKCYCKVGIIQVHEYIWTQTSVPSFLYQWTEGIGKPLPEQGNTADSCTKTFLNFGGRSFHSGGPGNWNYIWNVHFHSPSLKPCPTIYIFPWRKILT